VFVSYLLHKDLTRSLWAVLLATIFFSLGRYFPFVYSTPISGAVESFKVFGFNFSDVLLLLLLYCLKRSKEKNHLRLRLADITAGIIIAISIAVSYFSLHPDVSWYTLFQLLKLLSLFYISRILFRKRPYRNILIAFFSIFLALNSILMIGQWTNRGPLGFIIEDSFMKYGSYAQDSPGLYRPGGMSWDANYTAAFLSMGVILLITLLHVKKLKKHSALMSIGLVLYAIALLISASRGSWIVTLVMVLFIISRNLIYRTTTIAEYLKPAVIIPTSVFFIISTTFMAQRFFQFTSEMGRSTINTRLVHFDLGLTIAKIYPLGTGLNTFQYQIMTMFRPAEYLFDSTQSHNMIGELLADMGFLGMILFVMLFVIILRESFPRLGNRYSAITVTSGVFYMCMTYLLLAQIYPLFFSFQISAIFWIAMGAIYEKA
jgi:O-antigen ligase